MNGKWKYCPYCGKLISKCECDDKQDERFSAGYAEIEYDNFESVEAVDGARFDDLNF